MPEPEPLSPAPPAPGTQAASAPSKVCLVIVFNHRYDGNLPKLDQVYGGRFEHIRYLVPFYRGERPDVFPVFYSSFQFQGYFMEAWRRLRHEGFTHFVFCADDLLLHPTVTGENLCENLGLDAGSGYTKDLRSLSEFSLGWFPMASTLVALEGNSGAHWEQELPDAAAVAKIMADKGHPIGRLGWHNLRHGVRPKGAFQTLFYVVLRGLRRRKDPRVRWLDLPYPLVAGVSDFIVVPTTAMEKFCFLCSVLAATGVFVEVAIPTALTLSCERVARQADTAWQVRDFWPGGNAEMNAFGQEHNFRLDRLLANFGERELYLHPIKFSKWSV